MSASVRDTSQRLCILMVACASGAGLWLAIHLYGGLLDPRQVAWLIQGSGDSLQHYMGWEFFRDDQWRWPPGALGNLASEIGTSIVYTDSVPLVAFLLKPMEAWLPESFQYLGLVVAGNLVLNAGVACWVLIRCGVHPMAALPGALLVLLQPIATMRGIGAHGHEALSAHWLLWLGMFLLLLHPRLSVGSALRWLGLLATAILMHFYLFFMVGVLWAGWWLRAGWLDHTWQTPGARWRWLLAGAVTPALIVLLMWAAGYFHYGADGGAGSGYGVFSAELLTYLNPLSRAWFMESGLTSLSYFLPGWLTPVGGQYEGQAYAGLGGLALLAMGTAVLGNRGWRQARLNWPGGMTWLVLLGLAMFVFALSDRVVVGYRVFELGYGSWLGPLTDVLRSSGRLAWPLLYILLLSTLVLLARQWPRRRLAWVLAGLVTMQWTDMLEWHRWMQHRAESLLQQTDPKHLPYAVLNADELKPVWQSHQRIVALPADDVGVLHPYTWLAATYDMSINVAHLARITTDTVVQATSAERQRIERGELSADAVYVLTSAEWAERACAIATVQCREFDSVTVAWRATIQPLEKE